MVTSKYQEVAQHLKRVLDNIELASCHFVPFDGDFRNGNPELFGEQEKLDVEYPRSEMLGGEYFLSGTSREQFETTLGITDMSDADDTKDSMESVHEDVSKERTLSKVRIHKRHGQTRTRRDDGLL